jgi:hypothetical protein
VLLVFLLAQRARLTLSEKKGCLSSPVVAALIGRADVQTAVLAPRSAPAVALREPSPYRGKGDDGAPRGGIDRRASTTRKRVSSRWSERR